MIRNRDRSVGARIAGEIGADRFEAPDSPAWMRTSPYYVQLRFVGSAGHVRRLHD